MHFKYLIQCQGFRKRPPPQVAAFMIRGTLCMVLLCDTHFLGEFTEGSLPGGIGVWGVRLPHLKSTYVLRVKAELPPLWASSSWFSAWQKKKKNLAHLKLLWPPTVRNEAACQHTGRPSPNWLRDGRKDIALVWASGFSPEKRGF